MVLLPTMLQDLLNYPVLTTGLVTAPRGIGTMAAMFLVARLVGRVDTRLIILTGFVLTAVAQWQMTGFLALHGDGSDHLDRGVAGVRARLCLHAAEHRHVLDLAAAHPDARDRDLQPDAQYRRQRRHRDRRGAVGREHPDRAFAAGRAFAARQPARPNAAYGAALQPDRSRPALPRSTPRRRARRQWSPISTISS